jgi:hypothetical protein
MSEQGPRRDDREPIRDSANCVILVFDVPSGPHGAGRAATDSANTVFIVFEGRGKKEPPAGSA